VAVGIGYHVAAQLMQLEVPPLPYIMLNNMPTRRAADRAGPSSRLSDRIDRGEVDDIPPPAKPSTVNARLDDMALEERATALEEQDAMLDRLSSTVNVIQEMSGRISNELDEQAVVMDDVGLAVELAQGDVDAVTRRVNKIVQQNGGKSWCGFITALVVLLIILSWIAFT
jgi:hypothetical protein